MKSPQPSDSSSDPNACVENGIWTPLPTTLVPGFPMTLDLAQIAPDEANRITTVNAMTFHSVGCSGDPTNSAPGLAVAQAMTMDSTTYSDVPPASFLFHLGDIVYTSDDDTSLTQADLYTAQFYQQYADYPKEIFAIAGNHDGKGPKPATKHKPEVTAADAANQHFIDNFCQPKRKSPNDDPSAKRQAMTQPFPYWVLETPVAHIIGLYTNVANGGLLDTPLTQVTTPDPKHPTPQLDWFIKTLLRIKGLADGKAVVLTLHYPVYSGSSNFAQRGDPNATRAIDPKTLKPSHPEGQVSGASTLADVLQAVFAKTECYPDLVLSAHAHLYQRITYTYADGRQIPYLIAGCGGHSPIERLLTACGDEPDPNALPPSVPRDIVLPEGTSLPAGDQAHVVACDDLNFGFLSITIDLDQHQIQGTFCSLNPSEANQALNWQTSDHFTLDLQTHQLL